jgi:hypothetical protein
MAMHKTNSLLKYIAIPTLLLLFVVMVLSIVRKPPHPVAVESEKIIRNMASGDSAAESLDTLTADLLKTKQKIAEVSKDNEALKQQSSNLLSQITTKKDQETSRLSAELERLKNRIEMLTEKGMQSSEVTLSSTKPILIVEDLSQSLKENSLANLLNNNASPVVTDTLRENKKDTIVPYYTIPANGTSVKDKLMTALVGRIPIKGIVTDPYPFKIVISDDNLAANGLRIPHLLQMIVSGYCEGDLNLSSVRGWVTSLTFVFDDGTISSTTSNDNDIGNFTKSNSLGYLSDKYGNPFIRGKLITNAPAYLGGNLAMGAAVGAANAYAQAQTTAKDSGMGTSTSVTGSQAKFVLGQAGANAATEAQQWWRDRAEQSFDAVYVAPTDEGGKFVEIAVNFAKEIHIDYDPKGRKLDYARDRNNAIARELD